MWVLGVPVHVCLRCGMLSRLASNCQAGLQLSWERAYLASMEPRVWSCLPHLFSLPSRDGTEVLEIRVILNHTECEASPGYIRPCLKPKPHLLASVPFGQEGGLVLNFCTASVDYRCCANAQELHVLCLRTKNLMY